jgi:hypothetical protein
MSYDNETSMPPYNFVAGGIKIFYNNKNPQKNNNNI